MPAVGVVWHARSPRTTHHPPPARSRSRTRAPALNRPCVKSTILDLKFERRERDNVRGGHVVIMDESSHLAHNACVTLFEDMFQPQEHSRRTQTTLKQARRFWQQPGIEHTRYQSTSPSYGSHNIVAWVGLQPSRVATHPRVCGSTEAERPRQTPHPAPLMRARRSR